MSHVMRILVTEAASPTAYHLLPILASGDVIQGQRIELILCDCADARDDMYGVAMELQDCAFPMLSSISTTCDFCEACKAADVVIVLPTTPEDAGCHGNREVDICYSAFSQIDFRSLDAMMHPTLISKVEAARIQRKGPMSTAIAVADCLRQIHVDSLKEMQSERKLRHEEAEFGCPPDLAVEDVIFNHCDNHFGTINIESKAQIVFVTSRYLNEDATENEDSQSREIYTRVFARL